MLGPGDETIFEVTVKTAALEAACRASYPSENPRVEQHIDHLPNIEILSRCEAGDKECSVLLEFMREEGAGGWLTLSIVLCGRPASREHPEVPELGFQSSGRSWVAKSRVT